MHCLYTRKVKAVWQHIETLLALKDVGNYIKAWKALGNFAVSSLNTIAKTSVFQFFLRLSSEAWPFNSYPFKYCLPTVALLLNILVDLTRLRKYLQGMLLLSVFTENANKLEESAREHHIPCPEHYNGFCMHGKCEHSINMQEPSCR